MGDFASRWIDRSIDLLAQGMDGYPEQVMTADVACTYFHEMIEKGALPLALTQATGAPPPKWPFVDQAVYQAYENHTKGTAAYAAKNNPYGAAMAGKGMKGGFGAGPYAGAGAKGMAAYGGFGGGWGW